MMGHARAGHGDGWMPTNRMKFGDGWMSGCLLGSQQ